MLWFSDRVCSDRDNELLASSARDQVLLQDVYGKDRHKYGVTKYFKA